MRESGPIKDPFKDNWIEKEVAGIYDDVQKTQKAPPGPPEAIGQIAQYHANVAISGDGAEKIAKPKTISDPLDDSMNRKMLGGSETKMGEY